MTQDIKEKVLKGMFSEEFLDIKHTPETELTMKGIESAIELTLAEVGKILDEKFSGEYDINTTDSDMDRDGLLSELKEALGIK